MAIGTAGYTAMLCVQAIEAHGIRPDSGPVLVTGANGGVGSHTLANVCASLKYGAAVAACGLAQGMDLPATVAPFMLRGVTLYGIDSVYAPRARRERAWSALAAELPRDLLTANTRSIGLEAVAALAPQLLAGQVRGRVVVEL